MLRASFSRRIRPIFLCLAAFSFAIPTAAADDEDVVSNMSAGKIERILKSFRDVEGFKELADGTYRFEVDNLTILIFNKGETLQLFAAFEGQVSLSRINEWNRTKRFSRAYGSENGEARLVSDIELTGGVTEKNVKEWFKTYVASMKMFVKHLQE